MELKPFPFMLQSLLNAFKKKKRKKSLNCKKTASGNWSCCQMCVFITIITDVINIIITKNYYHHHKTNYRRHLKLLLHKNKIHTEAS